MLKAWPIENLAQVERVAELIGKNEGRDFSFVVELPKGRFNASVKHHLERGRKVAEIIPASRYDSFLRGIAR